MAKTCETCRLFAPEARSFWGYLPFARIGWCRVKRPWKIRRFAFWCGEHEERKDG